MKFEIAPPLQHTQKTHIKISCKNEKEQYSKKDTSLMSAIYIDTTSVEHVNFLFMFAQFLKLSLAINGLAIGYKSCKILICLTSVGAIFMK